MWGDLKQYESSGIKFCDKDSTKKIILTVGNDRKNLLRTEINSAVLQKLRMQSMVSFEQM